MTFPRRQEASLWSLSPSENLWKEISRLWVSIPFILFTAQLSSPSSLSFEDPHSCHLWSLTCPWRVPSLQPHKRGPSLPSDHPPIAVAPLRCQRKSHPRHPHVVLKNTGQVSCRDLKFIPIAICRHVKLPEPRYPLCGFPGVCDAASYYPTLPRPLDSRGVEPRCLLSSAHSLYL